MKKILFIISFILLPVLIFSQDRIQIEGTIVGSEDGIPIPGANIFEKGNSSNGAMTDFDGKFSLQAPKTATLVISYLGYAKQEILVKNIPNSSLKDLKIQLESEVSELEEIVLVGYGEQKKVTVTGSISSVGTEELSSSPSASVTNALAGKVTGLNSIQFSGQPGDDVAQLFIRGVGTLSSGNSAPLFMVDGVERDFSQLDSEEIADITILKDASATAVYGIRGANGVILVTTKRGKQGPAKITASYSYGLQTPIRLPEFADSYTYATVHRQAQLSDGIPEDALKFSPEIVEAFRTGSNPILYPNTDWLDYVVRSTSPQQRANFNVSGGSDRVKYFVSLSYLNQEGMFKTFNTGTGENFIYKRFNYRSNIDIDVTNTTQLSFTLGGRSESRQEPLVAETQDQLFRFLYRGLPYASPGIVDGRYIVDNEQYIPGESADALRAYYGRGSFNNVRTVYNFDVGLNQNLDAITKGLKFGIKGSYNRDAEQTKTRQASPDIYTAYFRRDFDDTLPADDQSLVFPQLNRGGNVGYGESYGRERSWYFESTINYNRRFGDHEVSGLLLYNQRSNYYPGGSFNYLPTGYVGSAARVTYNYKRRYLLEVNLGYNGSENFARDLRYGFFPAISMGWTVSDENFLKNSEVVSFLKLRASYGEVGSDRLGDNRFLYLPDGYARGGGYSFGINVASNQPGYLETQLGNPLITWETAVKQNYGIDMKLFDNKLTINADYFIENREDILTTRNTVPDIVAATLPAVNIGIVDNSGYELNLRWEDKIGDFNYWINPNVSYAKNEVVFADEIPKNEPYQVSTGRVVGQPFGFVYEGLFSEDDFNDDGSLKDTFPSYAAVVQPGDAIYRDLNGDGVLDAEDQRAIGFPEYPQYTFGLNLGFTYKNFDLRMSWVGAENVSRILGELRQPFGETGNANLLTFFSDRAWTPETSQTAILPRITFDNSANNFNNVSRLNQFDASYIRLKTLEMGLNLKSPFITSLGIKNARIYTNGFNLLTFDKLNGLFDPESRTGNRPSYPTMRIYNIGVKLNF